MRIQDLTSLTSLNDNDLIVVDDYQSAGVYNTKKMTVANLKSELGVKYTKLVGLLTQTGTNAPILTILENTTGATFTTGRFTSGSYSLTASSTVFTSNKTFCMISNFRFPYRIEASAGGDTVIIGAYDNVSGSDNALSNTSIEIRIYE